MLMLCFFKFYLYIIYWVKEMNNFFMFFELFVYSFFYFLIFECLREDDNWFVLISIEFLIVLVFIDFCV